MPRKGEMPGKTKRPTREELAAFAISVEVLLGALALGNIHWGLGCEGCQHDLRRCRCDNFMLCDDVGCADLLAIESGICIIVRSERRARQGDTCKHALGTRVGKHLGAHGCVRGSFSSAAYGTSSNAG